MYKYYPSFANNLELLLRGTFFKILFLFAFSLKKYQIMYKIAVEGKIYKFDGELKFTILIESFKVSSKSNGSFFIFLKFGNIN